MAADPAPSGELFVGGVRLPAQRPASGLYVVATPIGNLKDITLRALEVLATADLVLCEDTRHSARLFDHFGIRARRVALHEHNERQKLSGILAQLHEGRVIALISDAGTPLLSDPGFPLVRAAREAGLAVYPVPGPSALLAALAGAGLPTDSFSFLGFLPPKTGARANALKPLAARSETLVFYESPRRLAACLADMAAIFGPERPACVALELTKRHERYLSGTLGDLAGRLEAEVQKGEAVIVVAGASGPGTVPDEDWRAALADEMAGQPLRGAVDAVATRFNLKRKEVYDAALALKSAG